MSAGCPRAEDGTAQQRMALPIFGAIIGRVLFLCKKKTYYTSAESYVIYTNGCCARHDCLTSGGAWAFAVRVVPQGWPEPCVFPTIHKTGSAAPIARGSSRPGGGNSGN